MTMGRVSQTGSGSSLQDVLLFMEAKLKSVLEDGHARTEYELIKFLQEDDRLSPLLMTAAGDSLALYRAHFMLFHVLYRLADKLAESQQALLEISALKIRLCDYRPGSQHLATTDAVREYYLDWQNYDQTDAKAVDELIASFWLGLHRMDNRQDALDVLGLSDPVDDATIRRTYQRLVMAHHPDRGGDDEKLQTINAAVGLLLK